MPKSITEADGLPLIKNMAQKKERAKRKSFPSSCKNNAARLRKTNHKNKPENLIAFALKPIRFYNKINKVL